MRLAQYKLPIKTKFVASEDSDQAIGNQSQVTSKAILES